MSAALDGAHHADQGAEKAKQRGKLRCRFKNAQVRFKRCDLVQCDALGIFTDHRLLDDARNSIHGLPDYVGGRVASFREAGHGRCPVADQPIV
jgi:hypothetical protein